LELPSSSRYAAAAVTWLLLPIAPASCDVERCACLWLYSPSNDIQVGVCWIHVGWNLKAKPFKVTLHTATASPDTSGRYRNMLEYDDCQRTCPLSNLQDTQYSTQSCRL
jgi:hypothetical protein